MRARKRRRQAATQTVAPQTVVNESVVPTAPEPGSRAWMEGHIGYLTSELAKYEKKNPEATKRVKERLAKARATLKAMPK